MKPKSKLINNNVGKLHSRRQSTPTMKIDLPIKLDLKKYKRKHKLRSLSAAVKMLMEAKK